VEAEPEPAQEQVAQGAPEPGPAAPAGSPRRVAISCRLGNSARAAASSFASRLGLEAVVLSDSPGPNDGNALERLERLGKLDYAIVLFSADDLSATSNDPDPAGIRQGMMFEIGFLIGALGRGRVCFVMAGDQALVTDLDGIARHPMDNGGLWRLLVAREMRQAGLDVDLNRAM
jgi:predicted nucleotide-binding protein